MAGSKKLEVGHYLFREGEAPDNMYVVKSGKLAVVKAKANSEIVLAEISPGAMVGEMAFFDDKPRSASVKALKETEVIVLPYKALRTQFANFPEWAKAIMRTVNQSLRATNQRLKELESTSKDEEEMFPPHVTTRLISILNLVGSHYGKTESDGVHIPGGILRNYTIQIFQQPTHKMQKLMTALSEIGLMLVEDAGEGRQKIVVFQPDLLFEFVEWYNEWLFKQDKDRVLITEGELKLLKALTHFAAKEKPNEKGFIKINLTTIQNDSMRELGYVVKIEEFLSLSEKKVISEQMMEANGISVTITPKDLERVVPFWGIIYGLKKYQRAN